MFDNDNTFNVLLNYIFRVTEPHACTSFQGCVPYDRIHINYQKIA